MKINTASKLLQSRLLQRLCCFQIHRFQENVEKQEEILLLKSKFGEVNEFYYYTIGTQKRAITPIDENKYSALLHSLRPG